MQILNFNEHKKYEIILLGLQQKQRTEPAVFSWKTCMHDNDDVSCKY